jgi:hypothetical protein
MSKNISEIYPVDLIKSLAFLVSKFKKELHILETPFTDYCGNTIQIGYTIKEERLCLNDLGRVAGELFLANKYQENSKALKFVKDICETYGIKVDYKLGQLNQEMDLKDTESAKNFIKVIVCLMTVLPYVEK